MKAECILCVGLAVSGLVLFNSIPALAKRPVTAIPLGNPGDWINSEDYPEDALIDNVEGVVAFKLSINIEGKVDQCVIIQSSGAAQLDESTCRLITRRALFSVAKDGRGRPTTGSYTNRVRWVLPQTVPQPRFVDFSASYIVEKDGSRTNCQVEQSTGVPVEMIDKQTRSCTHTPPTTPFLDNDGQPTRMKVKFHNTIRLEPVP